MSKGSRADEGPISARAPAKINLWLRIHGRRSDGYHELSTLMACIDLMDELSAELSEDPGLRLELHGALASADIPVDESNLVLRVARAALERARSLGAVVPAGIDFRLHKIVPSQAGLGGGSSDAATALRLTEGLLGVELGAEWCRELLATLGADCVFFHDVGDSGLALCEGIGERVRPCSWSWPAWTILLLVPDLAIPTASVFGHFDPGRVKPGDVGELEAAMARGDLEGTRSLLRNDLEGAALRGVPELGAWRELFAAAGADHLRMSGSGSSFYGLYEGPDEALADLEQLRRLAGIQGLAFREARLCRPAAADGSSA